MDYVNTVITGTGSYVPSVVIRNQDFVNNTFFEKDATAITSPGEVVVSKFRDITGIYERRWIRDDQNCSDIAAIASRRAIENSGIDPETLDHIIVAHNFGDVSKGTIQTDILPCLAARVKHILQIENPACVAYDLIFGCPGWVQGIIQADSFIKSGLAKKILVVGTDVISRVVDKYDRDTMIFSDGAGAVVVEAKTETTKRGLLSSATVTHTKQEAEYLYFGKSNAPESDPDVRYIKMHGRKIYEYSLKHVPYAIKAALDKTDIPVGNIKKILIHQANEKMDEAIIKRFFKLYKENGDVQDIMPMNIQKLGNSSAATVPILYDMVLNGEIENHEIKPGDEIIFASVGAGMHINAVTYRQ
ncbi:MAG: 3-oxoacyl-ACP synthase III family protein [Bacteroidales bacterium]